MNGGRGLPLTRRTARRPQAAGAASDREASRESKSNSLERFCAVGSTEDQPRSNSTPRCRKTALAAIGTATGLKAEVSNWSNACRSPSASVRAAVVGPPLVGPAMVGPAIVMEMMVTVKTTGQEDRTADKQRPIEPRVPPVVWLGVGIQIDRLWRQRVDLLRQAGRIQRDLPAAIGLLAGLSDGLSRLPFNRDLRGELAAILKGHLRWDECCVRRARGNRPDTARQDQH